MKILDKSLLFNPIRESMQKLNFWTYIAGMHVVWEFVQVAIHCVIVGVNVPDVWLKIVVTR